MRAELNERGMLVILSDSPVESFALSHWFEMWQRHEATLRVQTIEVDEPQSVRDDPPKAA